MADTKIASLSAGTAAATDRIPTAVSPYGAGDNAYLSLSAIGTYLSATATAITNKPSVGITGGTVTSSTPVINATQTWNSGGVTFTGWKLDVTDTASASASLLMDLQVGGASKASVKKDGTITAAGPVLVPDGSNASPTLAFSGATGQGFYRSGTATVFASSGADIFWQGASYLTMRSNMSLAWSSGTTAGSTQDTILTRAGVATLQHGAADAAAPVAQTISFQSVATGTTDTAGVNTTFKASRGTGTGAGGSFIFQVAAAGSTGSTQNAYATALTINSSKQLIFEGSATAGLFKQAATDYIESITGFSMAADSSQGCSMSASGFNAGPSSYYAFNASNGISSPDTKLTRNAAGVVKVAHGSGTTAGSILYDPKAIASLPTGVTGMVAAVTDANAPAVGSTVASGGSAKALVWYNGTNWTVIGV